MFKKKVVVLFMVISIMFFGYSPATSFACSCIAPPSAQDELTSSSAVFSGKVIDMFDVNEHNSIQSSADPIAFLFEVEEAWKGVTQSQVVVSTERDSASCGYPFTVNNEYLVYAQEIDGQLKANICSRTAELSSASVDIEQLGLGDEPTEQVTLNIGDKSQEELPAGNFLLNNAVYFILLIAIGLIAGVYVLRRKKTHG